MTQAEGKGHAFLLRPVAMKPGEYKIVARRLYEVFSSAPKKSAERAPDPPSVNIAGAWEVEIQYEVGSARHKLSLEADGNRITGSHTGWAYQGDLTGEINGDRVALRSVLPADGNVLSFVFTGSVAEQGISGDVRIGEYSSAKWRAHRRGSPGEHGIGGAYAVAPGYSLTLDGDRGRLCVNCSRWEATPVAPAKTYSGQARVRSKMPVLTAALHPPPPPVQAVIQRFPVILVPLK